MNLDWQEQASAEQKVFFSTLDSNEDDNIKAALKESIEKATDFLHLNIHDDSMYFMFGWDDSNSTLTLSVIDETKSKQSEYVVKCCFSALAQELASEPDSSKQAKIQDQAESIRFLAKDYLTTCRSFHQYSLVAAYYRESWKKNDLL